MSDAPVLDSNQAFLACSGPACCGQQHRPRPDLLPGRAVASL